jgi:thymidine kinase
MPKLDIIIGPMFAGKSSELLRRIKLLKILNKKYLVIKPDIDNRYSSDHIVSHDYIKEQCITCKDLDEIKKYSLDGIDTVFIDEAQFFTELKISVLNLLENYNINVIISGLNGDSNREKFGEILDLIPICDNIIKLNALCKICMDGTNGLFTHRLADNKQQILIGTTNEFIPICRKHYLELNKS